MPLKPEEVVIVVDSREQFPYDLAPMRIIKAGLATGDYRIRGLESHIVIERKELSDLISCIGPELARFKRELQRMKGYPDRAVLVEASWADLASGNYRSRMNPESAMSTIAAWSGEFAVPFMMLGDRENAQKFASKFLFHAARRWVEQAEMLRIETVSRLASGDV